MDALRWSLALWEVTARRSHISRFTPLSCASASTFRPPSSCPAGSTALSCPTSPRPYAWRIASRLPPWTRFAPSVIASRRLVPGSRSWAMPKASSLTRSRVFSRAAPTHAPRASLPAGEVAYCVHRIQREHSHRALVHVDRGPDVQRRGHQRPCAGACRAARAGPPYDTRRPHMLTSTTLRDAVAGLQEQLIADRRHFHRHPELGFQEQQ